MQNNNNFSKLPMQPSNMKKKYTIQEYQSLNRANPIIDSISKDKQHLKCLCSQADRIVQTCYKCLRQTHKCLAPKPNRGDKYQCFPCLNRTLDPLVQVRKVLIESYFKTYNIFEYHNVINFQFFLGHEDYKYPVQIRGLSLESTNLTWPMQGVFILNEEKNYLHELKPLLYNSNKKIRRQEYFVIPPDRLRMGRNLIIFKIPCLDKVKFTQKFKYEEKKIYYMSINSIQRLSPSDLETQTFRERRLEKQESIKLLRSSNAEIEVLSNKVSLMCPYTKERIRVPVRGKYCKHFSCICLQTLIVSHSTSRYWGCPLCQHKINEPFVDIWIFNMLKDNQHGSQVLVKEDGTYQWVSNKIQAQNLDSDQQQSPVHKICKQPVKIQVMQAEQVQKSKQISQTLKKSITPIINTDKKDSNKQILQQINIISLDDDQDQYIRQQRSRKELQKKIKQRIKDLKRPDQQSIERSRNDYSRSNKDIQVPQKQRKNQNMFPKSRPFLITDIKIFETRQMKLDEFKKLMFKPKVNPYRKYIHNEEFKRLFKEII